MCIMEHGLELSHDHRVQVVISLLMKVKLCNRIMDVELSKDCRLSRRWHECSRKMVKITLNPKAVWS